MQPKNNIIGIDKIKLKYWLKLFSITGSTQILVQAVSFISGILVIRLLPVEQYALYTLANTMLGMMTILSDVGISTGVMALGGKVWQNKQRLGAVLATGLDLRRKFAGFSLLISIPILCYLLLHHGANIITTVLITASLIPAFYAALSDNLLQIPVKLHQAITPLQRNQVEVSAGRLVLTGLTLFAFPWAFVAIIASGIPRIWGNMRLKKITNEFADEQAEVDTEDRKEMLKIVRRIIPGAIYYALSGQITIWLISIFGKTLAVAQLGALNRISALFIVFTTLIETLIIPRFARLVQKKIIILKYYIRVLILTFLLMLFITGIFYLFSPQILWILGKEYYSLNYELVLNTICSSIVIITGIAFSLYSSRGWVLSPVISITLNILLIITGCFIFNISTLQGVLYLNIFVSIIGLFVNFIFGFYNILRLKDK